MRASARWLLVLAIFLSGYVLVNAADSVERQGVVAPGAIVHQSSTAPIARLPSVSSAPRDLTFTYHAAATPRLLPQPPDSVDRSGGLIIRVPKVGTRPVALPQAAPARPVSRPSAVTRPSLWTPSSPEFSEPVATLIPTQWETGIIQPIPTRWDASPVFARGAGARMAQRADAE